MKTLIQILLSVGFLGCGTLPHRAEFITEKKALAEANLQSNGILAFETANHVGLDVEVDFIHQESQKRYRVDFSPSFRNSMDFSIGPVKVAEKQVAKDVVSDSVALFQLPAGTYNPAHIYWRAQGQKRSGVGAKGNPFHIYSGKITSGGRVDIRGDKGLIFVSNVRVESGTASIEPGIRSVEDPAVSKREIVLTQIQIATK